MKKHTQILILIGGVFASSTLCADTITLNANYPTPSGSYDRLLIYPTNVSGINCDASLEGLLVKDSNNNNEFKICVNGSFVTLGGAWTQNGDDIFPADTLSQTDMKIGVGTSNPLGNLHLADSPAGTYAQLTIRNTSWQSPSDIEFKEGNSTQAFNIRYETTPTDTSYNWLEFWGYNTPYPDRPILSIHRDWLAATNRRRQIIIGSPTTTYSMDPTRLMVHNWEDGEDIMSLFDDTDEVLTVVDSGNVGIGNTNPQTELHIEADDDVAALRLQETTGTDTIMEFRAIDNNPWPGFDGDFALWGGRDGWLENRLIMNQDGDVAIGLGLHPDDEPNGKFIVIDDAAPAVTAIRESVPGNSILPALTLRNVIEVPGWMPWSDFGPILYFEIDDSGGATPHQIASIAGLRDPGGWMFGKMVFSTHQGSTTPTEVMRIASTGNVGIGTNAPTRLLYVAGSAGGTGAWENTSDQRIKKNIHTLKGALDKVMNLRGVEYEWKEPKEHMEGTRIGFIAQEVQEVAPQLVDDSEEYLSMTLAPMTALLVEAIKEQKNLWDKELEQNEQELNELEQMINSQQKQIEMIEQQLKGL